MKMRQVYCGAQAHEAVGGAELGEEEERYQDTVLGNGEKQPGLNVRRFRPTSSHSGRDYALLL